MCMLVQDLVMEKIELLLLKGGCIEKMSSNEVGRRDRSSPSPLFWVVARHFGDFVDFCQI